VDFFADIFGWVREEAEDIMASIDNDDEEDDEDDGDDDDDGDDNDDEDNGYGDSE